MRQYAAFLHLGAAGTRRAHTGYAREIWAKTASKKELKKQGCIASAACVLDMSNKRRIQMLTTHSRGGGRVTWLPMMPPPKSTKPVFHAICAPNLNNVWFMRDKDAEFLMLNAIANKLLEEIAAGRTIAGYIAMHVEYPPCGSCSLVIADFQKKFPNIKLDVLY